MLTIFSTPKPFHGHIGIIQRNALKSWTLLHPEVEIILFGDDDGSANVARELGIRYEPEIQKAEGGTKYVDYIFRRAQQIALHDVLCYVNCDIILTSDFRKCVERVASVSRPCLMVGRRWDTDIAGLLDFGRGDWESRLMEVVSERGKEKPSWFIDYFVFTRGLYKNLPPLVIGRVGWDNWLIGNACSQAALVVDASRLFKAVHQNHDYSYHPNGAAGVWGDDLAKRNYQLAGGKANIFTIDDATHELDASGRLQGRPRRTRFVRKKLLIAKYFLFNTVIHKTFALRDKLGMRKKGWLGALLRSSGSSR